MEATKLKKYNLTEYLEMEENAEDKHEFYDGEIFAMAGGTHNHSVISSNIGRALGNALDKANKNCIHLNSEMRIALDFAKAYVYPDGSVYCGKPKFSESDSNALANPLLIIEVMSKSTRSYDRGEKFWKYRQLSSFQEYILIEQSEPVVEVHTRQDDGSWRLVPTIGLDKEIILHSLGCTLSMKSIYHGAMDLQQASLRVFRKE